jgi:antitoxin (DNA-binding transcriptional repressor) of toxin-antitoxin stability system
MLDPCPLPIQPWWQWHPPVGTYIGILGVLGVIVPWLFRPPEKMGRGEKALWTLLLFILFGLELRTLYLDRDEHDAQQAQARCQQLESFQKIADGINTAITTSQSQFNQTMLGLQTTIGGTQQAIKNTTPYADIQVDWMGGPIINGNPHTPISLVFGTPIAVNLFYHNAGLARADGVRVWFHFYVGKPDNLAAQRATETQGQTGRSRQIPARATVSKNKLTFAVRPPPASRGGRPKNWNRGIIMSMGTIHISEADAARDFAGLLARVRAGAEVVIESDAYPVAVLHTPAPPRRSIEECIALLPADSSATVDEDFASDVAAAVAAHREPLNPPAWD